MADYVETSETGGCVSHRKVPFDFPFYLCLLSGTFLGFHHLLCLLHSLILSRGVGLPVSVPSLWLTGLRDVTVITRMCP